MMQSDQRDREIAKLHERLSQLSLGIDGAQRSPVRCKDLLRGQSHFHCGQNA